MSDLDHRGCATPSDHEPWVRPLRDAVALNWPMTGAVRHATLHVLALLADRERQLAEANKDLAATVERMQRIESIALAAEAKLRAVAALRDQAKKEIAGKSTSWALAMWPFVDRLDAILGGDT